MDMHKKKSGGRGKAQQSQSRGSSGNKTGLPPRLSVEGTHFTSLFYLARLPFAATSRTKSNGFERSACSVM